MPNLPGHGTGDGAGGYYNPDLLPYPSLPSYQDAINITDGLLDIQILDEIHNLVSELPNLYAENLLLAGEDVVWLPRLTTGKRCPDWNDESDQCDVSKCQLCFGTGFYQGFGPAVQLKMSFIPSKSNILVEQAGLTVKQRPMAWTIATNPSMAERDMIVTYSNERYLVHDSESVEKQGRRVYQSLTLSRIDKTDALYYVPVPSYGAGYNTGSGYNSGFIGVGETLFDLPCSIQITPFIGNNGTPGFDLPCTIYIRNYYFNSTDGITPVN